MATLSSNLAWKIPWTGRPGVLQFRGSKSRAIRTYTGLGKQTLGEHKQNLVGTRTQEKGEVTPQN